MGVADPSSGAPILAVASLAAAVQHISMECFSESGAPAISQMTLLPGQSSIATACPRQGEDAGNADPLLAAPGTRSRGPVAIRLTSDGAPGAFSAFALAPHADDGSRSFSSVLFNDPQAARSSDIVFVGVAVGSASLLPSGAYTPHISLANFSTAPLHVHIQFAHTSSGDTAAPQEVSTVTIDPGVSREVTLADLRGDPDMQNSFIIAPDGAPGVLAAKFVAQGEGPLLRRLELQAKDEGSRQNAGGHPWSLEDGTESTLLLFNHGNKSQHFTVAISGSESWQKTYTLAAMETKAVSLRDLVESRTTDDSGRTLSPDVQSGEASWFVPDSTQSTGRLLQSNRATGMARNYSCGFENLLCGSSVSIYQSTFPDGSVADFADITGITCTSGSYTACSGAQTGTGGYYNTRWSAGSPNIAPISGSNTNSNVNLQGAAAGSSFTTGIIQSAYCSSAGGGTAVVQVPTALRVVKTISNGPPDCPVGYNGSERIVNRAVVDQNGHDILQANQTVNETVTANAGQDGLFFDSTIQTGPGITDASGQYPDMFQACSTACPGKATTTATQTNHDQLTTGGTNYPLTNSTILYSCTNIKINGSLTP